MIVGAVVAALLIVVLVTMLVLKRRQRQIMGVPLVNSSSHNASFHSNATDPSNSSFATLPPGYTSNAMARPSNKAWVGTLGGPSYESVADEDGFGHNYDYAVGPIPNNTYDEVGTSTSAEGYDYMDPVKFQPVYHIPMDNGEGAAGTMPTYDNDQAAPNTQYANGKPPGNTVAVYTEADDNGSTSYGRRSDSDSG